MMMAPVRTYTDWNKRPSDAEDQREPFRKYFFICEGANTEVWYFRKLIDMRKKLGIHPLIDIRLMEKTEKDAHLSNPKALIDIVALFTDKSGMNPKENPAIGELAVNIHTAIDQERKLNQNAENALSNLTSNIGKIVQGIMNDVV